MLIFKDGISQIIRWEFLSPGLLFIGSSLRKFGCSLFCSSLISSFSFYRQVSILRSYFRFLFSWSHSMFSFSWSYSSFRFSVTFLLFYSMLSFFLVLFQLSFLAYIFIVLFHAFLSPGLIQGFLSAVLLIPEMTETNLENLKKDNSNKEMY